MADEIIMPDLSGQPVPVVNFLSDLTRVANRLASESGLGQVVEDVEKLKEEVAALQTDSSRLIDLLNTNYLIDGYVKIDSDAGTGVQHDLAHNLASNTVIAMLEDRDTASTAYLIISQPVNNNEWRFEFNETVNDTDVTGHFWRVTQIDL